MSNYILHIPIAFTAIVVNERDVDDYKKDQNNR